MTSPPTSAATLARAGEARTPPDLLDGIKALGEHSDGYKKAHAYYVGEISEVFASARLRRAMAATGVSFRFNFAKIPVDTRSERIQISAVAAEPEAANKVLQDLWKQLKMNLYSRQYQRRALELGDAYVMVWPTPDGAPDTEPTAAGDSSKVKLRNKIDICYNSPRSVRIFYDPERPIRKRYAIKQWALPDKTVRADLYYPDRIEKYRRIGRGQHAKWVQAVDNEGDTWPYPNPFGEVPFFHFRTDEPYGEPVHKGFYGPQDTIHKLIMGHMAGVDYTTFPQRYALVHPDSDTAEPAAADEDEFSFGDDGGATQPDSEGRSQLTADPGSVWWLNGVAGVGQFDPADPRVFTDPMLNYLRFGAQITNTPLHRIDPTGDQPSGESLRTAEAPFAASCKDLAESFDDTWVELLEFALRVLDVPVESVDVQWDPVQSTDDIEGWQTLKAKLEAGLPVRQAFMEAGYSADQVEKWFPDDSDDLPFAVELLGKIGDALAKLGTAMSLGVLSPEQLQALIEAIVGDLDGDTIAGLGLPPGPPRPPAPQDFDALDENAPPPVDDRTPAEKAADTATGQAKAAALAPAKAGGGG